MKYILLLTIALLLIISTYAAQTKCRLSASSVKVQEMQDVLGLDDSEALLFLPVAKKSGCKSQQLCKVNCSKYFPGRKCSKPVTLKVPKSGARLSKSLKRAATTLFGVTRHLKLKGVSNMKRFTRVKTWAGHVVFTSRNRLERAIKVACGADTKCSTANRATALKIMKETPLLFQKYLNLVKIQGKNPVSVIKSLNKGISLNKKFLVGPSGSNRRIHRFVRRYIKKTLVSFVSNFRGKIQNVSCQDALRLARFNRFRKTKAYSKRKIIKRKRSVAINLISMKNKQMKNLRVAFKSDLKNVKQDLKLKTDLKAKFKKDLKVVVSERKNLVLKVVSFTNKLRPRRYRKIRKVKKGVEKKVKPGKKKEKKPKKGKKVKASKKSSKKISKLIKNKGIIKKIKIVKKKITKKGPKANKKVKKVVSKKSKLGKKIVKKVKVIKPLKGGFKVVKKQKKVSIKKKLIKKIKKTAKPKRSTRTPKSKKSVKKLKKSISRYHAYMKSVCAKRCSGKRVKKPLKK